MEKIMCPICNESSVIFLNFSNVCKYKFCPSCKTAWNKNVKTSYKENYYKGKYEIASLIFRPIEFFLYFIRRTYVGTNKKKIWLDVGAGEGNFLNSVSADRKIGIEISAAGRKFMQGKGIETMSEKEFLQLNNLNADVISFWHVLEHIEDPLKYLKTAKRNIFKKGKIVIGIPNIDSFDFKVFQRYWFHLAPKYHLWHFSPKSIEMLLSKSGLRIEYIDYFSIEHHLPGVLQSFINWTSGSENVLHGIVKRGIGDDNISVKNIFWIVFWLTIGLPLVVTFWITSSIFRRSGTIVLVAVQK